MKKLTIMLMVLTASLFTDTLSAQELTVTQVENSINKEGKYGMLVRNAEHLKASVKTGLELIKENPKIEFQIVICGVLVKDLAGDTQLRQLMQTAKNGGVNILACGLSMKKFSITELDLPPTVEVTENGLLYIFGLQENGYKTITL